MKIFPFTKNSDASSKPGGRLSKDAKLRAERDKYRKQRNEFRDERKQWRTVATSLRDFAAKRYIHGTGIEIGGLHHPLKVYNNAVVKYVDRLSTEEIRKAYPNVADQPQVTVDIVDNGETLETVADGTFDFVIANHMLEHTRNPIGTVKNMLRVLKPEGILYLAIPDKRFTFDIKRDITPYEHVRRDYLESPDWSDRQHYEEWVTHVVKPGDEAAVKHHIEFLAGKAANIHFHAWTQMEIIEMFTKMKTEFGFMIEFEAILKNGHEVIVIVRKAQIT